MWRASVRRAFEGRERVVPEPIEIRAQRFDPAGIQLVETAVADRPVDDELCVFEDAQVLGDRGPADRKARAPVRRPAVVLQQPLEDGAPGGVAEGIQLWRVGK